MAVQCTSPVCLLVVGYWRSGGLVPSCILEEEDGTEVELCVGGDGLIPHELQELWS